MDADELVQHVEVAWANALEAATQAVCRYAGLNADRQWEDDPRYEELSWTAAAGFSAGLDTLITECRRHGISLANLASVARDEHALVELRRSRRAPLHPEASTP